MKKDMTDDGKSILKALSNVFVVAGASVIAGALFGWKLAAVVWGVALIIGGLKGHSSVAP